MEKVPPAEANHGQRSSSDPINYSKQLFHRKKKMFGLFANKTESVSCNLTLHICNWRDTP